MPVRAVLNFVYVYCKPSGEGVKQEDIDQYDAELYANPDPDDDEEFRFPAPTEQTGG